MRNVKNGAEQNCWFLRKNNESMVKKVIFLLVIVAVIFYLREKNLVPKIPNMKAKFEMESKEKNCIMLGGKYLKDFNECEFVNDNDCREMEGKFNDCASACRHTKSGSDSICTMQCVAVCSWN